VTKDLGTINLADAPMNVTVQDCAWCGAITAITFNGKGIDNSAAHAAWHESNPGCRRRHLADADEAEDTW
jgi:hypothetical protein